MPHIRVYLPSIYWIEISVSIRYVYSESAKSYSDSTMSTERYLTLKKLVSGAA